MSSNSKTVMNEKLIQAVSSLLGDALYQEIFKRVYPDDESRLWEDEEYAAQKRKQFLEELLDTYLKKFGYKGVQDPKLVGYENIFITQLYASPIGIYSLNEYMREGLSSATPIEKLRFANEVLKLVKGNKDIATIAAGAIEDLFCDHCDEIYEELDQMIRSNPNMRKAIQGVWCHTNDKLMSRLKTLLDKYGLKYSSL